MKRTERPRVDSIHVEWKHDDERPDHMSCVAVAQVSYDAGNLSRRLEWLRSSGLHGIDTQSSTEYRMEITRDEIADLREHLARFGITYSDRNWRALRA